MFSISNDELKNKPVLGKTIKCPKCGEVHTIRLGEKILEDGTKVPSDLSYYKCGEKLYLIGIGGKRIF